MRYFIHMTLGVILIGALSVQVFTQSNSNRTPDQSAETVYTAKDVTKKLVLLEKPEPGIISEKSGQDVCGVVRLRAVLSALGDVMNISVLKELP